MPENPLRVLAVEAASPELHPFEEHIHSQRIARESDLLFLLNLGKAINSAQDLQTLLHRLAEQLEDHLALDAICLYLIEESVLYLAASTTTRDELVKRQLPADGVDLGMCSRSNGGRNGATAGHGCRSDTEPGGGYW